MIDNTLDIIDSRQVIERIEELLEREEEAGASPMELEELKSLQDFAEAVEPYCTDWHYGETLIRHTYFKDYARELAEDLGEMPTAWPYCHIDWDAAAEDLKQDYSEADLDGVTYYYR